MYHQGQGAGYIMATLGAIIILFLYRQFVVHT